MDKRKCRGIYQHRNTGFEVEKTSLGNIVPAVVSFSPVILEQSTVLYRMLAAKLDTNSSEDEL